MKPENKNKFVHDNISKFRGLNGYFIGRFMGEKGFPLLETDEVEVSWKKLPLEFNETGSHFHKGGIEVNIIIKGCCKVSIEGKQHILKMGDFLVVYPETKAQTISSEPDTEVIVIKAPSLQNDKFLAETT